MTRGTALAALALALAGAGMVWTLFVVVPGWHTDDDETPTTSRPSPGAVATRKITARLFYVSEDGLHLAASEREVMYGETPAEQATHIIEAQLAPAPPPYTSTVPEGTTLRNLFLSGGGVAYVDLSSEVSTGHPGGSLSELFTVYSIVDALTANLPAITSVQILIDGKEADTLAGHVDLRRPFQHNTGWLADATPDTTSATKP
jgi:Sporulation and spore germination